MKVPSTIKTYCPRCRMHTQHKVKQYKAAPARKTSRGQRKHIRHTKKGYGGKYKAIVIKKKQAKKPTFKITCSVCGLSRIMAIPKRMRKIEIE